MPHSTTRALVGAIAAACVLASGAPARASSGHDPVRRTIERAFAHGAIDREQRHRYLSSYTTALHTDRRLPGVRRSELGYVIGVIRRLALERRLAGRLAPLFLILDRNREWWSKAGPPAPGTRVRLRIESSLKP